MPTIITSPTMVPTAIPTKAPGNGRGGKSVTVPPGEKLGRTLGSRAVAGDRIKSLPVYPANLHGSSFVGDEQTQITIVYMWTLNAVENMLYL